MQKNTRQTRTLHPISNWPQQKHYTMVTYLKEQCTYVKVLVAMFSFQDTDKFKLFEENYGNFRKIDFLCTISICFTFFVCFLSLITLFWYVLKKKGTLCIFCERKYTKTTCFYRIYKVDHSFRKGNRAKLLFFSNLQLLSIF